MPTFSDMRLFLSRQLFGRTVLPKADLKGKTMIITGGNSGLGLECAKHLVRMGVSQLVLGCRDVNKGEEAVRTIQLETKTNNSKIEVWHVDLASYQSVLSFGNRVQSTLPRLDGFVANAGLETPEFQLAEGTELHMTVNVISTVMLAAAVLPKLRETSHLPGTSGPSNLTFVGSSMHVFGDQYLNKKVDLKAGIFSSLSDSKVEHDMAGYYSLSKLLLHMCAEQLSQAVSSEDAVVNWVNPGWCGTQLARERPPNTFAKVAFAIMGRTAEEGSRTLVHGVTMGRQSHGRYLSECEVTPESTFRRSAAGRDVQRQVWKEVCEVVGKASPAVANELIGS